MCSFFTCFFIIRISSSDIAENWEANVKDFSRSLLVMEGYKSQMSKDMNMCLLDFR